VKFTDKYLKSLKPKDKEYQHSEPKGFTMRVLPTGVRRWEFIYVSPVTKKRRRMHLGNYSEADSAHKPETDVSLETAHQAHHEAYGLFLQGIDPQEPIPVASEPESDSVAVKTVRDLYNFYIQDCKDKKLAELSIKHKEQRLSKHIVDPWGDRLITSIKKNADAVPLIKELARSTPGTARNVMLAARAMFGVAVAEELLEANPFSKVLDRVPQAAPNEVERFLKISEIQHVVPLLRKAKEQKIKSNAKPSKAKKSNPGIIKRVLLMILYTGQRPGEVAGLKWTDFEEDGHVWFLSRDETKTEVGSLIYLSSPVRRLIAPLRGLDPVYVFPASRGAEGSVLVTSLDSHIERYLGGGNYAGLPRWTPHDLRRTCSTHLQRLKCPDPVIWSIQNHAMPGISRVYNRYEYSEEKREWLIRWALEIRKILRNRRSRPDYTS
jgi:integrase